MQDENWIFFVHLGFYISYEDSSKFRSYPYKEMLNEKCTILQLET